MGRGQLFETHTCYDHHVFQQEVTMGGISSASCASSSSAPPETPGCNSQSFTATPSPLRWTGFSVAADSNQRVQPPPVEAILGLMINLVCNFVENSDSSDLANASPMLCQQGIMWNAPKALGETPLWGLCNWIFIVNHTQPFLTTKHQQQQVCWQAKLLYLLES